MKFIKILGETSLLINTDGLEDERRVIPGKIYKVYGEDNNFYEIRFGSKFGYLPKHCAQLVSNEEPQKIMIAWDYISSKDKNVEHYDKYINKNCIEQGLDVISPTWFLREGDIGNTDSIKIVEKCDKEYVRLAHSNGYEVWGLIADFNADRNYMVYTNESLAHREIMDIVNFALQYNLDGINIDFEGFGSRCREAYNLYVKKLSEELRKHNIVVSIDVARESNSDAWGKCYDRGEISKHVDYLCLMAYDENGRLDVVPGSTGSLPWVEEGIKELLNMGISREKIILGVPFYSRDWRVEKIQKSVRSVVVMEWEGITAFSQPDEASEKIGINAGDVFEYLGEYRDYYKVLVNKSQGYIKKSISKVLDAEEEFYKAIEVLPVVMKEMENKKKSGSVNYDQYAQQTKLIYTDDTHSIHYIWLEDTESMKKRIDLVKKYDLPGAAAWMLTQETEDIWNIIKQIKIG